MKPDKLLYKTPWLKLFLTKKGFIYAERKGVNSVAALIFKKQNNETLFHLRYQLKPNLKDLNTDIKHYPCCITGTIEKNETPIQTVIKEVLEESGFYINEDNILNKNVYLATTQSNEAVYTYIIKIDQNTKTETPKNDGSYFEAMSYNLWVNEKELNNIFKTELVHSSLFVAYKLFLDYKAQIKKEKNGSFKIK